MSEGVLYYNSGQKMAARLAVSAHSLREYYSGPVCLLSEGEPSHAICRVIAKRYDFEFKQAVFPTPEGRGRVYINASLAHTLSPYENTMWLDSDTLVVGDFSDIFQYSAKHEFAIAQISNWLTHTKEDKTRASKIGKRVMNFATVYPDRMEAAIAYGPAINCGVYAFLKGSQLMRDWYKTCLPVRDLIWIPDEVTCQMMLPDYPHAILPHWYNVSCKHDDPFSKEAKIIHYHGRKHCRIEKGLPIHGAGRWLEEFDCFVRDWAKDWIKHDRQLRHNLKVWDKL